MLNVMLNGEEKSRIRDEEIFREEVRREMQMLRPDHAKGKRLWSLLNSSFALWFLSSIVLGGLTATFTQYNARRNQEMLRAETQRRLNTEIGSRIVASLAAMRVADLRAQQGQVVFPSAEYSTAWRYLNNSYIYEGTLQDFSIYSEYQKRSFQSLLYELGTIADRETIPILRDAQGTFLNLEQLADQAGAREDQSIPPDKSACLSAVKKSIELLEHLQSNSNWRTPLL